MDETILVVGASGKFAGLVVPELARRGADIRAVIHDARGEPTVRAAGAQDVVVADLTDPASVAAALRGVERVFYIAPVTLRDEATVGKAFVEAAIGAGVRRFVFSAVIHPVLRGLPTTRSRRQSRMRCSIPTSNIASCIRPCCFRTLPWPGTESSRAGWSLNLSRMIRASAASTIATSPKWPRSR